MPVIYGKHNWSLRDVAVYLGNFWYHQKVKKKKKKGGCPGRVFFIQTKKCEPIDPCPSQIPWRPFSLNSVAS